MDPLPGAALRRNPLPRNRVGVSYTAALIECMTAALAKQLARTAKAPSVVINFGMGVDSAAILLRYLTDPSSRDFDWDDAVVITAQTGDEFEQTGVDVENHILPLLRANNVRFVQVARGRRHVSKDGDGVVVLSDSNQPTKVYIEGAYKLSDELLEAGTLAQRSGSRLWIARVTHWTQSSPRSPAAIPSGRSSASRPTSPSAPPRTSRTTPKSAPASTRSSSGAGPGKCASSSSPRSLAD